MDRRQFLRLSGGGATILVLGGVPLLTACTPYGALLAADANGVRLPNGFTSRIVATSGQAVGATGYTWHLAPDGGAVFDAGDGGWIYVSNAERSSSLGGVSMVRFDASGAIVDARSICSGTSRNCAGGTTPWGTWLSCEETATGQVWECDPFGVAPAVARPAMGRFNHEAAAVDPDRHHVYLTEDQPDSALYRFVPTTWPDLSSGVLQVLTDDGAALAWQTVPDPAGSPTATRNQVANTKRFNGGEGACYRQGKVYFTTKGDNRVWVYDAAANTLVIKYDDASYTTPALTGVDNITVRPNGELYVAEDGGDMQIVFVGTGASAVGAVVELPGVTGSEITGPAFTPDGSRLYFSSQRNPGVTYEITGPWR